MYVQLSTALRYFRKCYSQTSHHFNNNCLTTFTFEVKQINIISMLFGREGNLYNVSRGLWKHPCFSLMTKDLKVIFLRKGKRL